MTLGDIIKEYLKDHTMTEFSRESGLSRAYAYLLIKNKSNQGGEIVPSIETVKKVAKGVHMTFDEVISMLDNGETVRIEPGPTAEDTALLDAYHAAPEDVQRLIMYLLAFRKENRRNGKGKI